MKEYEINEGTLAIMAIDEERTAVFENEKEYNIELPAYQVMENSCHYYGSSYLGRVQGAEYILGKGYKMPIIVDETRNIIFFPTISPVSMDCTWLALNKIKKIDDLGDSTRIIFNNNQEISLNLSYRSVQNQLYRAARLDSIIRNRKK